MADQEESTSRKPTHRLYQVIGDGDAANWKPLGAAWAHKDGKGFSITCDAMPLRGRMVLRAILEKEEE